MFDYVVVGCGFAGSILARKIAEEQDKKVLVIDRRNHIAGNMYDYVDKYGIRIQKYGPHVFHSNSREAYDYIAGWCEQIPFRTKCEVFIDDIYTPSPFNFKTIDQLYGGKEADELKGKLIRYYKRNWATVVEMLTCEEADIRKYAEILFEKDYRLYTAKQWNVSPGKIDPSVLKRVPVLFSYRDTYFDDMFEFLPKEGFEALFEAILKHKNITVRLQENALEYITFNEEEGQVYFKNQCVPIIWTGAIDELFAFQHGKLPYRSLEFEFRYYEVPSFQDVPIVAYPQAEGYTRITEYTKMPVQNKENITIAAYEYPYEYDKNAEKGNEPYYPVLTEESQKMYGKYSEYSNKFNNLILCGRLAEFKYYNMDQVILRALEVYEEKVKNNV